MTDYQRVYCDRQGNPITMQQALDRGLFEKDAKRVAEDTVGPYWISTVHLRIDHGHGRGRPLIFETMVFAKDADPLNLDNWCERYCTEDEAKAGHTVAVAMVRDGLIESPAMTI